MMESTTQEEREVWSQDRLRVVEADYRLRVYTLEQVFHAPRKVKWSVMVL